MNDFSMTGFQPQFCLGNNLGAAKLRQEFNVISHQVKLSSCANYLAHWHYSDKPLCILERSFEVEGILCV
ncbi:MAG: hypothetical protein ACJAYN_000260 [Bermanella sp.]|jgi:hypothetical protein|nr:hypothetical protein CXF81_03165 [Glaciecola sp. 33A]